MGLSKAKVRLKDGFKVTALLDASTKMNVMTRKLIKEANLAMRKKLKLEWVSYTSHRRPFLKLYENIEIAIRGLKIRHPIFIVEVEDHKLVLGQSFSNSMKFCQKYKPNEIFGTITHPYMHQTAVFRTLALQDPVNQRENQIFP